MIGEKLMSGINMSAAVCKNCCTLVLGFSLGTVIGLFLPSGFVAFLAAAVLAAMAYLCLSKQR